MWKQTAAVAVGTVMAAASASAGPAQSEEPRAALAVTVIDLAHVPRIVLARAAHDASTIYDLAGVSLVWNVSLSPVCDPPAERTWVRVVLYSGRRSEALGAEVKAAPMTMGFAPCAGATTSPCTIAYIFYDRIEDMARATSVPAGRLLGLAIAHEIGHMLLPRPSHSKQGIMRPSLHLGRAILPQFTPAQAEIIRARLDQNR